MPGAADATAPILAVEIVAARARAVSGGRVRAAQLLERRERVIIPACVAERHRERGPRAAAAAAVAGPAAGAVPAAALRGQLVLAAAAHRAQLRALAQVQVVPLESVLRRSCGRRAPTAAATRAAAAAAASARAIAAAAAAFFLASRRARRLSSRLKS